MKGQRHMTAFYLETVLMVIIFVLVISVLAQVFAQARTHSEEARRMTNAVCLAQNAAEAVAAAGSGDVLAGLLDEDGNTVIQAEDQESAKTGDAQAASDAKGMKVNEAAVVTAFYDRDMHPVEFHKDALKKAGIEEGLKVEITWEPQQTDPEGSGEGTYVDSEISVSMISGGEPLYTMRTGVYVKKEQQEKPAAGGTAGAAVPAADQEANQ